MNETVFATLRQYDMIHEGDSVIAALSGGADSVALLHFLQAQRAVLGITVSAAHFDHGLRGEESERDAAFVRQLCGAWGMPLTVGHGHMAQTQKPGGLGTEAWARQLRYAFFEEVAAAHHAKIATAHTLSDNAETVLLRACRGAGPRGLAGIPPVRGCFIRPLIGVSRAQVEAYLASHGVSYVEDSTNTDESFARNRLRHTVLPALEQVHPGAAGSLARLAADMREVDAYLAQQARQLLAQAGQISGQEDTGKVTYKIPVGVRFAGRYAQAPADSTEEASADQGPRPRAAGRSPAAGPAAAWRRWAPSAAAAADARPGVEAATLLAAPQPVRLAALSLLAGQGADRAALARMEQVLAGTLTAVQLPGGAVCRLQAGRMVLAPAVAAPGAEPAAAPGMLPAPGATPAQATGSAAPPVPPNASTVLSPGTFTPAPAPETPLREGAFSLPGGYRLSVQCVPVPPEETDPVAWARAFCKNSAQKGLTFAADCDKILECSVLRTRRPGDTFAPAGRGVTKPLKKWMNEERVPLPLRANLPLLALGQAVQWVWGAGFSATAQPDAATRRVLLLTQLPG